MWGRLQEAHRRLVQDEPSDPVGEQGRFERTDPAIGVPQHVHPVSRGPDDRGHVLVLALDRVPVGIAALAAAARSIASTVKRSSSAGSTGAQRLWSAAAPCTRPAAALRRFARSRSACHLQRRPARLSSFSAGVVVVIAVSCLVPVSRLSTTGTCGRESVLMSPFASQVTIFMLRSVSRSGAPTAPDDGLRGAGPIRPSAHGLAQGQMNRVRVDKRGRRRAQGLQSPQETIHLSLETCLRRACSALLLAAPGNIAGEIGGMYKDLNRDAVPQDDEPRLADQQLYLFSGETISASATRTQPGTRSAWPTATT